MRVRRVFWALLVVPFLGACSVPGPGEAPDGVWDPYEDRNRKVHAFNKGVDKALLRPVSKGYVAAVPSAVRTNVSSFADTVGTPKSIVNQLLQGDLPAAGRNTLRFVINATMGLGGIADVATAAGLPRDPSGFGETLAVWGAPEGAYLELPLTGPSTQRDRAGRIVDFFLDPLNAVPRPERYYATGARVLSGIGQRGQFSDTVDSVLYESADSYSQSRLIYLQNRRFELGEPVPETEAIDPMALDTEGF